MEKTLVKIISSTNPIIKKYYGKLMYFYRVGNYSVLEEVDRENHGITTSKVVSLEENETNIILETLNSFYTLEKVGNENEDIK